MSTSYCADVALTTPSPYASRTLGLLALLWLAGLYLRIPVLSAPPLADDISRDLALGALGSGALTMTPLLMLALGATPSAWLMRRLGVRFTLVAGLVLMAVMSAGRGLAPSPLPLFAATAAMGLGIAAMQTSLPGVVKSWTPNHVALGSAVYMNGMIVGEFAGAGLTLPVVLPLAGGDWRMAWLLWSLPVAAIAALLMLPRGRRVALPENVCSPVPGWRDGNAWRLGVLLAGSIVVFFVINAYMGRVLEARGAADSLAGLLMAFNLSPLVASLMMLAMGRRWLQRRGPILVSAMVCAGGLLGFMTLPGLLAMIAAVVASFSATLELVLLVSLPPALTSGAALNRLTAGMYTIGYGIAFILPLVGGVLADAVGNDLVALVPAAIFALLNPVVVGGLRVVEGTMQGNDDRK